MGRGSVVIVGAGAGGLAAAFDLTRAGSGLDVRVLEARDRLGGSIRTLALDDCVIDAGTDAVRTARPAGMALCADLGLADRMVAPRADADAVLVAHGGRVHRMPRRPFDLATRPFVSWRGRARAAIGLFRPRHADRETSAGEMVERRFGNEVAEKIAEPLVAGTCASDIDRIDADVAMSGAPSKYFAPRGGMIEIVDALGAAVGAERVTLGAAATAIAKAGSGWRISVAGSDPILADALVIGVPSHAAAALLSNAHAELADEIRVVRSLPMAAAVITFDAGGGIPHAADLLIARTERRATICATIASAKWPDRSPPDRIAIRAFVGGDRSPDLAGQSDDAILSAVLADLGSYWRLPNMRSSRVVRFGRAAASPPPGHRRRIASIEARAVALGGLHFVGGAYAMGLGFSSSVEQARRAAREISRRAAVSSCE